MIGSKTQAVATRLCSIVEQGPGNSWKFGGRKTLECRASNQASEFGGGEEGSQSKFKVDGEEMLWNDEEDENDIAAETEDGALAGEHHIFLP